MPKLEQTTNKPLVICQIMEWHVFLINALPHKLNCATPPQNPDVFIHRHFVAGREELTFTEIVQRATCDTNSEQSEAFYRSGKKERFTC